MDMMASTTWTMMKPTSWSLSTIPLPRTIQTAIVHQANTSTTQDRPAGPPWRRHRQPTRTARTTNDADKANRPIWPAVVSETSLTMLSMRVAHTNSDHATSPSTSHRVDPGEGGEPAALGSAAR